jgi:hypothetical protein
MAAEQFNDSFWLAVAAAAPVIGLAAAVTADQAIRRSDRAIHGAATIDLRLVKSLRRILIVSAVNIGVQGATLLNALISLSRRADFQSRNWNIAFVSLGMVLVFVTVAISAFASDRRRVVPPPGAS